MNKDLEVQENKNFIEWYHQIVFLKDKLILPNGMYYSKSKYISENSFNNKELRQDLLDLYNKLYK